jgi:hypothetical protein
MIPHSQVHGDDKAQNISAAIRAKEQQAISDFMFFHEYLCAGLYLASALP